MSKSMWGKLKGAQLVRTPKKILEEQANALTDASEGALFGRVDQVDSRSDFIYDLDVVVPTLNNYTYTVVRCYHPILLYPVRVAAPNLDIPSFLCETEAEFVSRLGEILGSELVTTVLTRLMSQA